MNFLSRIPYLADPVIAGTRRFSTITTSTRLFQKPASFLRTERRAPPNPSRRYRRRDLWTLQVFRSLEDGFVHVFFFFFFKLEMCYSMALSALSFSLVQL